MMSNNGSAMSRDELIMRIRGSGCKMLDRLDLWTMSIEQIKTHLEKSCCKVYEKILLKAVRLEQEEAKRIEKENNRKD